MSSYAIATTVEPTTEPVTLAEAKMHLRVPTDNEDQNIERIYIPAARKRFEAETGRQLITATKTLSLDSFPSQPCPIKVPCPPLQSVNSIQYVDTTGVQQTLSTDDYVVDSKSEPGRIFPAWGSVWPATRQRTLESTVLVNYVAGYGTRDAVPDSIKEAMLLLIGHYYYHREDVVVGASAVPLPRAVSDLLESVSFGDEFEKYGGRI